MPTRASWRQGAIRTHDLLLASLVISLLWSLFPPGVTAQDTPNIQPDTMEAAGKEPEAATPATPDDSAVSMPDEAEAGGAGNTLAIEARHCPPGTDRDQFLAELNAACADAFPGVDFRLSSDGSDLSGITGDDGFVRWSGLANDIFSVQGVTPDGYGDPIVFCGISDNPGGDVFRIAQIDATDGQIQVEIEGGPQDHRCYWFIREYPRNAHVTVVLQSHECPLGFSAHDRDLSRLHATCNEPMEGITFTLEHASGSVSADTTSDGITTLEEIPAGDLTIETRSPDGYDEPLVECSIFANYVDLWQGVVPSENGTITINVPGDATNVICWFSHTPDPPAGENRLTLQTFACPPNGSFEDLGSEISGYCTDTLAGMEFTLTHADLGDTSTIDANADGVIIWSGLPSGSFTLAERLVSAHRDVIVHCEWTTVPAGVDVPSGQFAIPAPLGVFTVDFPADSMELNCGVFNLPRYASRIFVDAYLCPPNADLVLTDENSIGHMITSCRTEGNGIAFTLDNAHGSSTQTLGDGSTQWYGVPHGPFTLTKARPDGYRESVWYCRAQSRTEGGDLEEQHGVMLVDTPGGVLSSSIDADFGEDLACWVFYVPDPTTATPPVTFGPLNHRASFR